MSYEGQDLTIAQFKGLMYATAHMKDIVKFNFFDNNNIETMQCSVQFTDNTELILLWYGAEGVWKVGK